MLKMCCPNLLIFCGSLVEISRYSHGVNMGFFFQNTAIKFNEVLHAILFY